MMFFILGSSSDSFESVTFYKHSTIYGQAYGDGSAIYEKRTS